MDAGNNVTNVATADSDQTTPVTRPAGYSHQPPPAVVVANPGIEIQKSPDSQNVVSGTAAIFTIQVTNTGDVDLTDVTVIDEPVPDCSRLIGNLAVGEQVSYSAGSSPQKLSPTSPLLPARRRPAQMSATVMTPG